MNIFKKDDVVAITMKSVNSTGQSRTFEIHKLNKETMKFEDKTSEVAHANNLKLNKNWEIRVGGYGMNMETHLKGIVFGKDYPNTISLNVASKKFKEDFEAYKRVSGGHEYEYKTINEDFPYGCRDEGMKAHLNKVGKFNDPQYAKQICIESKEINTLSFFSDEVRDNKEVVLEIVKEKYGSLQYVSDRLKDDKEVVKTALQNDGSSIAFASDRLRDDKEVVLQAVKQYGRALEYASDRLKDDKEIVMEAAKNGMIAYASDRLKNDKEVALEAIKNNSGQIVVVSDEIKKMCEGKDPIQTIEKAIAYDKLKTQLKPKHDEKQKQQLKI